MKVGDGLLFPVLKPPVARDAAIVLVDLAITSSPIVELALSDSQPLYEVVTRQLSTIGPAVNVIYDSIASVMGNPGTAQSSPSSFFN
jgi:hypothetical protein